jgi:hypothetical protein
LFKETDNLTYDLQLGDYPQSFIDLVINSKCSSPGKGKNPLGSVYIPYMKGISGKYQMYIELLQH